MTLDEAIEKRAMKWAIGKPQVPGRKQGYVEIESAWDAQTLGRKQGYVKGAKEQLEIDIENACDALHLLVLAHAIDHLDVEKAEKIMRTELCSIMIDADDAKELIESKPENPKNMAKNNVELFREVCDKMADTYAKKNEDYGDSFGQSLNEHGLVASIVRMGDKFNRIKQLFKANNAKVKDESIKDTLLDLACYAVMTLVWLMGKED